jgi:hypothetical protein
MEQKGSLQAHKAIIIRGEPKDKSKEEIEEKNIDKLASEKETRKPK